MVRSSERISTVCANYVWSLKVEIDELKVPWSAATASYVLGCLSKICLSKTTSYYIFSVVQVGNLNGDFFRLRTNWTVQRGGGNCPIFGIFLKVPFKVLMYNNYY